MFHPGKRSHRTPGLHLYQVVEAKRCGLSNRVCQSMRVLSTLSHSQTAAQDSAQRHHRHGTEPIPSRAAAPDGKTCCPLPAWPPPHPSPTHTPIHTLPSKNGSELLASLGHPQEPTSTQHRTVRPPPSSPIQHGATLHQSNNRSHSDHTMSYMMTSCRT